jgi:hypothetical protein
MRVRNDYTASLTFADGKTIAPGQQTDTDGTHHVVKAWLAAGMISAVEPAPTAKSESKGK